jgi:hypothetical protein
LSYGRVSKSKIKNQKSNINTRESSTRAGGMQVNSRTKKSKIKNGRGR